MNLYKLPDSLANPANAILSTMDRQRPLADVANTKAAAAAQSPMPPPPPTPGTSGKKRKRSEASLARDKLVSSKKYQTYKLYEVLQHHRIIKDPKDADDLDKYLCEMAILERDGYREYKKDMVEASAKVNAKLQELTAGCERQRQNYEDAAKSYKEQEQRYFLDFLKFKSEYNTLRCETMEQKLGLMEDRAELRKKIEEQKQLQQKFDELKAEVKELRKLKYAADRKAKGPVGVAR